MDRFIPMSAENSKQFAALYRNVFNASPWNDGWSMLAAIERLESFAAMPTFRGLSIFRDDKAIGIVLGWGERWVNGWLFHLKEVCVHADYQRQGIGQKLMHEFEKRLSEDGFVGMNLQTGMQMPARNFYEKLGYAPRSLVTLSKPLLVGD